ncbi:MULTISPECIES: undecaprenyl-diphosphate phosphatase [Larsenimonas]|uniref:Undecaprenyl-diphosphatase n=1 Tax=Larsenimonas suaedae TaxID=1851019 RepID=A0ABU1GTT9_9GAMM|nr:MULTISPECIES: undecaprenyl-diphosphate phosphatase [Larsenimonas]MCM2971876.1 undecaprenyl-diphosphate phosphatase [Larsenimonas suaedae]MCM5703954.1 undecaprenyl-diphosphate phosphatase [Larsenimonas salina]MDR5895428.1 undecaprenyl-diphosphate phosphatase [Larsenimonas suaedae]
MEWMHVVALALIQGLSEFLPISSSAHLILPSQLFGWPDQGLAFDVAVHVGTLLAVIMAFWTEIKQILAGWFAHVFKRTPSEEARMGWCVLLGTLPALFFGYMFESVIESYARSALVIAATTIIFGLLLWWADKRGRRERDMPTLTFRDAFLIGVAQALALIPGTSRSGITITAALMMGFTRQAAAKFSFLLSIPLILAAGTLKGIELAQTGTDAYLFDILGGVVISFVSALVCIKLFLAALDRIGMLPFVIYRLVLGAVLLVAFL